MFLEENDCHLHGPLFIAALTNRRSHSNDRHE